MTKLIHNLKLPAELNRLTDPDFRLGRIGHMIPLHNGDLMVTYPGQDGNRLHSLRDGGKGLKALRHTPGLGRIWPAEGRAIIGSAGGTLWRIGPTGRKRRLLDLPTGVVDLDVGWDTGGLIVVALVNRDDTSDEDAPILHPSVEKTVHLCQFDARNGWMDLAEVPARCTGLSMSRDGRRVAWAEYLNSVPEEASRGEFRGYDAQDQALRHLTNGAGQIGDVILAPTGAGMIYEANHSLSKPITTHTDLWWLPWHGDRRKLTGGGRCIWGFGWLDAQRIWVNFVEGVNLKTEILHLGGKSTSLRRAASSEVVRLRSGDLSYETESASKYPFLVAGKKSIRIKNAKRFDDLRVRSMKWNSTDGTRIEGVLYEKTRTPRDAPLLVSAHGGPAGTVHALRSASARYLPILQAGYRVLNPAFRGSKGFGDQFLQANIGSQGEGDLEDILTGVDHCKRMGVATGDRVGIFGGSYGGYMTLRALAVTDRFQTGVALFGFVSNRWMTLETGDFTYENEYIAPLAWPVTKRATRADVFPHIADIRAPLLLLHGDKDPICSLSQSAITYRALEDLGRTVGMVVYPGEGHGFAKKKNQRDSSRQLLAWFLKHLPP